MRLNDSEYVQSNCPNNNRFMVELQRNFKLIIEYTIIKIYEDSESEPLNLRIEKNINVESKAPFNVEFKFSSTNPYIQCLNHTKTSKLTAKITSSSSKAIIISVREKNEHSLSQITDA
jgi:hypothetical protein